MAEHATIMSSVVGNGIGPASFAVISRTTSKEVNGNHSHSHIHNTHITQNGHNRHNYRTAPSTNVINHQSSISSTSASSTASSSSSPSSSSHIKQSQSYHANASHPTTTTQEIKHLTLSVTPTSVSSNSLNSSRSMSPSPHRMSTPPHLISKSYHSPQHNHHLQPLQARYSDPQYRYMTYDARNNNNITNHRSQPMNGHSHNASYHNKSQPKEVDCTKNKCKSSIISRTVLQLIELGINPSNIRWPNITMQSHEYITILTQGTLNIIDTMQKKVILTQHHCTACSAMVNPQNSRNIHHLQLLAMRNKNTIKVMHLNNDDNHQMMIEHKVSDEDILFWRWLDSEIIAFITTKSVYHWMPTMTQSKSKCILTLNALSNSTNGSFIQYINYNQSKDGNYIFVQGLTQSIRKQNAYDESNGDKQNGVDGVLTLYDINSNIIQPTMNAFGGCFASLSSFKDITLFCYTKKEYIDRERRAVTKLYIVELSRNNSQRSDGSIEVDEEEKVNGHKYHIRVERVVEFYHTNDFVVSMVQCQSVLYAVTKLGCLLIFDISSGTNLYNQKVSRDVIFLVTPFPKSNGIVSLDRTGKLTLFYLNKSEFSHIPHLLPNKNVSVLTYNVYNNSFAIKFKDICYESSFFLSHAAALSVTKGDEERLLCIGHVKMVLCKALHVTHIGYITISNYNVDGSTVLVENSCILTEDMRFFRIEINNEVVDKSFGKILNFYHMNYGIPIDIMQELLSENLFNYHCDELKIFTMNYLLNKNNSMMATVQVLEKKISLLNGERLNNLRTDELFELEQNVNNSYTRIRTFIRGKFKCIVCYEAEKHILFKPCHHYVVCVNCSDKLMKCPICKTDIDEKIKIYQ